MKGLEARRRALRVMTRIAAFGALVAILTVSACNRGSGPRVGDRVPDFVLPRLDGTVQKLSNYRGEVVMLNLWATWCPPCIEEMPLLNELAVRYAGKGLTIVGIAGDENADDVRSFVQETPLQFDVLLDPHGAVGTEYGITGYPETFLIDRDGKLLAKFIGPLPYPGGKATPELVETINQALGTI
jgi:DsbE subfamily thiol:disulfide oxidoreductase